MWDVDQEIRNLEERAEDILGAKISTYDQKEVPGRADSNPTESKNIEYSMLMVEIEKKKNRLAEENNRTYIVINRIEDAKLRGMTYSRYILRKTWTQIGKDYNYERSRAFDYRKIALDTIYPFIPKGEINI
jgi:hypothetical protein